MAKNVEQKKDFGAKYKVKNPDLLQKLIQKAYGQEGSSNSKQAMGVELQHTDWDKLITSCDRDLLMTLFLGGEGLKAFYEDDFRNEKEVYRLFDPNAVFSASRTLKLSLMLKNVLQGAGLSMSSIFHEYWRDEQPVNMSAFSGWYLSYRNNHETRKFALLQISEPNPTSDFKISGWTFPDKPNEGEFGSINWHGTECVINPSTRVGYYKYESEVDTAPVTGFAQLRFDKPVEGLIQSATGLSIDSRGKQFSIQLERVNIQSIPSRKEEPLDPDDHRDRLPIIRFFQEKYLGKIQD